jgi:hypothetical protein
LARGFGAAAAADAVGFAASADVVVAVSVACSVVSSEGVERVWASPLAADGDAASVSEDDSSSEELVDDCADDSDPGVSAHATPYPLITAAPTHKATAKPPTPPTHAAALTLLAIRP